jgi:putative ABC transport system substrate-binding protein
MPRQLGPGSWSMACARDLGALLIANHPLFTTRREQIIALAARYAVPTIYVEREFARAGGPISYGMDLPEVYRLTGGYAGRILRGDKPADLPVLLPTKFEMIINLRTAKMLGLEVPDKLIALADEVIE